jgi:TrmH family RNA methyltransferase
LVKPVSDVSETRFVLVEPSHPGNIGAAARAIKTMGFDRLCLVRPAAFPHAEASARASGADDVLDAAVVCDTLEDALNGVSLVFGTSARQRTIRWPQVSPRACAAEIAARTWQGCAAVVFGRERVGLNNAELELCQYMLYIPSNPEYSSLNLASAVQLVAYELRLAGLEKAAAEPADEFDEQLATHDTVEAYYEHLQQTLVGLGFLDPDNPRQLMRRLRRLYSRAQLRETELNILRGILTAADKASGRK